MIQCRYQVGRYEISKRKNGKEEKTWINYPMYEYTNFFKELSILKITPNLKVDPSSNNEENLSLIEHPVFSTLDHELSVNIKDYVNEDGRFDKSYFPDVDLATFIVLMNFLIQTAKKHNQTMKYVVFYHEKENAFCEIKENVVTWNMTTTIEEQRVFLIHGFATCRENIIRQAERNEFLHDEIERDRHRDEKDNERMANWIKGIYEENKDSIQKALRECLVEPFVNAVKEDIINHYMKTMKVHEIIEPVRKKLRREDPDFIREDMLNPDPFI